MKLIFGLAFPFESHINSPNVSSRTSDVNLFAFLTWQRASATECSSLRVCALTCDSAADFHRKIQFVYFIVVFLVFYCCDVALSHVTDARISCNLLISKMVDEQKHHDRNAFAMDSFLVSDKFGVEFWNRGMHGCRSRARARVHILSLFRMTWRQRGAGPQFPHVGNLGEKKKCADVTEAGRARTRTHILFNDNNTTVAIN